MVVYSARAVSENGGLGDWDEEGETPPRCQRCGSPLRPDVVLLGEGFARHDVIERLKQSRNAIRLCFGRNQRPRPRRPIPVYCPTG
jgi:NAD-dependent SIR2 family protein deacetylase